MGYRDERDALKMRVEQLEGQLARANDEIARLQGEAVSEPSEQAKPDGIVGVPLTFELEKKLPFAISQEGYEAIAELLRERLPQAQVSKVGRTLSCRSGLSELRLTPTGDGCMLRIEDDHSSNRWGVPLGGFGFAVLFGPLALGPLVGLAGLVGGAAAIGVATGVAIPLALILGFFAMRALVQRNLKSSRATLRGVSEAISDIAERHALRERARIANPAVEEAEAMEEALAAEEAERAEA